MKIFLLFRASTEYGQLLYGAYSTNEKAEAALAEVKAEAAKGYTQVWRIVMVKMDKSPEYIAF